MRQLPFRFPGLSRIKNRAGLISGIILALAYYLLAGLVPALNVKNHYPGGKTIVNLYAHLFHYGQFFGWISVLLLIRPVTYIAPLRGLNRWKDRLILLTFLLAISMFVVALDMHSQNIPPYEVRPEILEKDDRLRDHFTKTQRSADDISYYEQSMAKLTKSRANWSMARYVHYLTVFIHAFTLLFLFFVVAALTVHGASAQSGDSAEFKISLVYCSLATLISYLWVLMRVAFNHQKPLYFSKIANPVAEYVVMALFTVATLLIAVRLSSWLKDYYSAIVSLATISVGILSALAVAGKITLVEVFGKDAGTLPYWTILGAIASLFIFAFLAHRMNADQNSKTTQKAPD